MYHPFQYIESDFVNNIFTKIFILELILICLSVDGSCYGMDFPVHLSDRLLAFLCPGHVFHTVRRRAIKPVQLFYLWERCVVTPKQITVASCNSMAIHYILIPFPNHTLHTVRSRTIKFSQLVHLVEGGGFHNPGLCHCCLNLEFYGFTYSNYVQILSCTLQLH